MSVACASRFAVLKLEDDEPTTTNLVKSSNETNLETKPTETKTKNKKKKKKNCQDDASELQSMAFGATKAPKLKSSQQQKSKQNQHGCEKQWEEWKKKDAEFVSETYEQDLEQAILLSKIDFEEKKDIHQDTDYNFVEMKLSPLFEPVVNLATQPLTKVQIKVLSLGRKFVIPPNKSSRLEILADLKNACSSLEEQENYKVHNLFLSFIDKTEHPNLSEQQQLLLLALNSLKVNNELIFTLADKSNHIVIMDRNDYIQKMNTTLQDINCVQIPSDRSEKIKNKLQRRLAKSSKLKELLEEVIKDAKSGSTIFFPRLYERIKIHKDDNPIRPVVSTTNSPFYDIVQKEAEQSKPGNSNHKKKKNPQKKDKPTTMTLEDFQNLPSAETSISKKDANSVQEKNVIIPDESDFFNKLEDDVEKIINQEQRQESYQRVQTFKDDQLRNIQYKDELEKKDQEIEKLKEEIKKSKLESKAFKERMKLMSKLLFEGEMQDKAKILVQVDKLTEVKDELTEQVVELHALLEQERSKVHALTTELKKYQNRKKDNK